jgi:hypothetical protein
VRVAAAGTLKWIVCTTSSSTIKYQVGSDGGNAAVFFMTATIIYLFIQCACCLWLYIYWLLKFGVSGKQ